MTARLYWRVRPLANRGTLTNDDPFIDIAELEFRTSVSGSNAATGGTAIYSGVGSTGGAATTAFDGNTATRWDANPTQLAAFQAWIGYKFASAVDIVEVAITSFNNGTAAQYAPADFLIESSDDGIQWYLDWIVNDEDSWTGTTQTKAFAKSNFVAPDPTAAYRYWRLKGYDSVGGTFFSVNEIEMHTSLGGSDVCTGGTAIESSHFNDDATLVAANAFDNNNTTRWASKKPPHKAAIGYDFGSGNDKAIVEFSIQGNTSGEYPRYFALQYSSNGTKWYTATYYMNINTWASNTPKLFATAAASGDVNMAQAAPGNPDYCQTFSRTLYNDENSRYSEFFITTTATLGGGLIQNLIDGAIATGNGNATWFNASQSTREVQFDFGTEAKVRITEFRWYQDTTTGHGTWVFEGSDDASSWTGIGGSFTLGGATPYAVYSFTNTVGYRYYRIRQTSGSTSSTPWLEEIEFKAWDLKPRKRQSIFKTGGQGDRTATITLTKTYVSFSTSTIDNLVDGSYAANAAGSWAFNAAVGSGNIQWDFLSAAARKVSDGFRWGQNGSGTGGVFSFQGSNDASSWTDIITGWTMGTNTDNFWGVQIGTNTTSYRYYRLLQTSGTTNTLPWMEELELRVRDPLWVKDYKETMYSVLKPQPIHAYFKITQYTVLLGYYIDAFKMTGYSVLQPPPILAYKETMYSALKPVPRIRNYKETMYAAIKPAPRLRVFKCT